MSIIKHYKVDHLEVMIFETRNEMGRNAGEDAATEIKKCIQEKGFVNILFAAAPSQNETLATLCEDREIDWKKVNAFHMDEYIGLDPEHPSGFANFLKRAIFDKFEFRSCNYLSGNTQNLVDETDRYSLLLRKYPLDVCLCGIGENGHIAFNDPAVADFDDKDLVKTVDLDDICRQQQVNDGCFDSISLVPKQALTVTVPGIMSARKIICSVPASTKAQAVKHMLEGKISTDCPSSILREHPNAKLYLDMDSAESIL